MEKKMGSVEVGAIGATIAVTALGFAFAQTTYSYGGPPFGFALVTTVLACSAGYFLTAAYILEWILSRRLAALHATSSMRKVLDQTLERTWSPFAYVGYGLLLAAVLAFQTTAIALVVLMFDGML